MCKKGWISSWILVCLFSMLFGVSVVLAESRTVPFDIDGAEKITLYRYRDRIDFVMDTNSAYPGWFLISKDNEDPPQYRYGRWDDWSGWTAEAVAETETRQVETRIASVIDVPESSLDIWDTDLIYMLSGTGAQIVAPEEYIDIIWDSVNPSVASVDVTGYVSAISEGATKIHARSGDGSILFSMDLHVIGHASRLPANTSVIESEAFASSGLQVIDLRNTNVKEIRSIAFLSCENLKLVLTDDFTGMIEGGAFAGASSVMIASETADSAFQHAEQNNIPHYLIGQAKSDIPVTGLQLSSDNLEMVVGSSVALKAVVNPANATSPYVKWSAEGDAIEVDDFGLVTALHPGSAVVTVKTWDDCFAASCTITVQGIPLTSVTLDTEWLNLIVGETAALSVTTEPGNATDPSIKWESQNPNIAYVIDGVVTAYSHGSTVIEAKSCDGSEIVASCVVTVQEKVTLNDSLFSDMGVMDITDTDATIYAAVNVSENPDLVGFYIGTDTDNLEMAAVQDTKMLESVLLTDISYNMDQWGRTLTADTTYYYRFYMLYDETLFVSDTQSFRTLQKPDEDGSGIPKGDNYDNDFIKDITFDVTKSTVKITVKTSMRWDPRNVTCELTSKAGNFYGKSLFREYDYSGRPNQFIFSFKLNENISKTIQTPRFPIGEEIECVIRYTTDEFVQYSSQTFSFTRPRNISMKIYGLTELHRAEVADLSFTMDPELSRDNYTFDVTNPGIVSIDYGSVMALTSSGITCFNVNATVENERILYRHYVRMIQGAVPRPDPEYSQIRLAAMGIYETKMKAKTMQCNAENIAKAYARMAGVGRRHAAYIIDPKNAEDWMDYVKYRLKDADDDDVSIIYIGGHGHISSSGLYALVLDNGVFLLPEHLFSVLNSIKGYRVFIVDSCHSGLFLKNFLEYNPCDDMAKCCIITASSYPGEIRWKTDISSMPGNHATYMMYYYLQGIGYEVDAGKFSKNMPADRNGDNCVTVTEIFSYMKARVTSDTANRSKKEEEQSVKKQTPLLYIPDGIDPVIYRRDSVSH